MSTNHAHKRIPHYATPHLHPCTYMLTYYTAHTLHCTRTTLTLHTHYSAHMRHHTSLWTTHSHEHQPTSPTSYTQTHIHPPARLLIRPTLCAPTNFYVLFATRLEVAARGWLWAFSCGCVVCGCECSGVSASSESARVSQCMSVSSWVWVQECMCSVRMLTGRVNVDGVSGDGRGGWSEWGLSSCVATAYIYRR